MNNIVLIGFMGSGKTTIGIKLSYKLSVTLIDTDKEIEREQGCTITELFRTKGEACFRQLETAYLAELGEMSGRHIISTGGGTPIREENRDLLRRAGTVVLLRVRPETVYERIKSDKTRPLLQCEAPMARIRELMEARAEAYEAAADLIIDVDGLNNDEVAEQIVEQLSSGKIRRNEAMKLLVINGPNINFLGIREKNVYGTQDYDYLLKLIGEKAHETGSQIEVFQSNHEGAIIDRVQDAYSDGTEGIVINPGAYTHYSYAIHDALASVSMPKIEIHISNIMEREDFRKVSVTAPACDRQIYGQGLSGYLQAIDYLLEKRVEK